MLLDTRKTNDAKLLELAPPEDRDRLVLLQKLRLVTEDTIDTFLVESVTKELKSRGFVINTITDLEEVLASILWLRDYMMYMQSKLDGVKVAVHTWYYILQLLDIDITLDIEAELQEIEVNYIDYVQGLMDTA
jgi:hypothetical protein